MLIAIHNQHLQQFSATFRTLLSNQKLFKHVFSSSTLGLPFHKSSGRCYPGTHPSSDCHAYRLLQMLKPSHFNLEVATATVLHRWRSPSCCCMFNARRIVSRSGLSFNRRRASPISLEGFSWFVSRLQQSSLGRFSLRFDASELLRDSTTVSQWTELRPSWEAWRFEVGGVKPINYHSGST